MAKRTIANGTGDPGVIARVIEIEYWGPAGQTSPLFGDLEVGRRYQADPEQAAYLCRTHPEYWRAPDRPEGELADGRQRTTN